VGLILQGVANPIYNVTILLSTKFAELE